MVKRPMSEEHKAALARGRAEGKLVRNYLEALRTNKPKRGRRRTVESISKRIAQVERELVDASAMFELQLVQERRNLQAEINTLDAAVDIAAIEQAFVEVAASYGSAKGIDYASWREVGVPADVLKRAGITRGRSA